MTTITQQSGSANMTVTNLAAATEIGTVEFLPMVGGVLATLAFFAVGVAVLAAGFAMLDALTPGNLRHQVYVAKNPNAALLLGANTWRSPSSSSPRSSPVPTASRRVWPIRWSTAWWVWCCRPPRWRS